MKTTLVALGLAAAGSVASAATVGTLYDATTGAALAGGADLKPGLYTAVQADVQPTYTATFDYVYNFVVDAPSDLNIAANTYLGPSVDGTAEFNLYAGTSTGMAGTAAEQVGSAFVFGSTMAATAFESMAPGSYFFEVEGSPSTPIGTAFNVTVQVAPSAIPLPAVPEPANRALLLAGLGLMTFVVRRRARD